MIPVFGLTALFRSVVVFTDDDRINKLASGQESPGLIFLYKLVTIFVVVENIQKRHFFLKKLLVNEFRTAMGGG